MSHTPGPLSVELSLSDDMGNQYAIASDTVNTRGQWNDVYVRFSGYFGSYGPNLFAAAPDLLSALQQTLGLLEAVWPELEDQSVFDAARAAIAKATQ